MYNVSSDYKEQINKQMRNLSYIKVNLGVIEPDAQDSDTMTTSGSLFFSDLKDTDLGMVVNKRYHTMEHNRFILDGKNLLPPEPTDPVVYYQGYVSDVISGANGVFTSPPTITITFSKLFSFVGLTFRFDSIFNSYPTEMEVTAYNGASQVYHSVQNPNAVDFVMEDNIPASGYCDKIVLKFNKTFPYKRRVCMEYIMFGLVKFFTDDTITKATWTRETDLLTSKLPTNSFQFTTIDLNKDYNPDNAVGFWRFIEKKQPVSFQYGYELDDGSIEWINGGHLLTSGEINIDSSSAIPYITFKATSVLNQLTDVYYGGVYSATGRSLYDLAVEVLDFCDLPLLVGGGNPYYVTTALQSIITHLPLPQISINQVLQLIANAGRCVLYVDRMGQIRIERPTETPNDFTFDFSNIKNTPKLSKVPALLTVTSYYSTVEVDTVESNLITTDVSFATPTECRLTYEGSTAQNIQVSGSLVITGTPKFYAKSCIVTLTGTGGVIINGKLLKPSKQSVTFVGGEVGYDCPMENALLNTKADAQAYADWIGGILQRRNQYDIEDRGYPEIDPTDCIHADTLFSSNIEVTVTASKIEYNGTLSGTTSYISKEVS